MAYIFYSSLLSLILVYSVDALCSKNEVYYQCQPCAAINCFDSPPFVCPKICQNPGCYCETGYLRKNGICIPEEQCSSATCGPNEYYYECQPCAALSCGDRPPEACIALCRNPGCYCRPGYLRKNGVCVPEQFCYSEICGPHASYSECQPCAAINCGDTDPEVCPAWCINPGCYCDPGYLRYNGVCIPEKFCPTATCGKNEVYRECQPCAAINCGDKPPEVCIEICQNPGCYCKSGFLRKNGVCVPEKLCLGYI